MKNNTNIVITIILPVYNAESYLNDCFLGIINQTYKNFEVIFVNDGSTDNSRKMIEMFCKKYKFARLINQKNRGVSISRSIGVCHARGKFIYFADPDDIINKFSLQTLLFVQQKQCSDLTCASFKYIAHSQQYKFLKQKSKLSHLNVVNFYSSDPDTLYADFLSKFKSYFSRTCWNKLYKKSILKKMKNYPYVFPKDIKMGEDTYFLCNYLKYCKKVSCIKQNLYYYRKTKNSSIRSKFNPKFYTLLNCISPLENLDKNKFPKTWININALTCRHAYFVLAKMYHSKENDKLMAQKIYKIYKKNYKYVIKTKYCFETKLFIFTFLRAHYMFRQLMKLNKK